MQKFRKKIEKNGECHRRNRKLGKRGVTFSIHHSQGKRSCQVLTICSVYDVISYVFQQVLTKAEQQDDATMPNGGDWNVVSEGELKKMQKDEDGVGLT